LRGQRRGVPTPGRYTVFGTRGAVDCATRPLAVLAGIWALNDGGNADAKNGCALVQPRT
jgi:hypothetical protein